MYIDTLMNGGAAMDWGICGIGLQPSNVGMRDVLAAQDGLYTLVMRHSDGTWDARVIGSMMEYLFAPDDPEAVIEKMAAPATRIVSLTVTEGGYNLDAVTGAFDASDPSVAGRPAAGRRAAHRVRAGDRGAGPPPRPGHPAFTHLVLRQHPGQRPREPRAFTAFARLRDPALADWITATSASPTAWSTASRRRPPTPTGPSSAAGSASRTSGRCCASRSRSGYSRTASPTGGRRSKTPACRSSPTSSPTS